jgi:hypothetical protein
MKIPDLYRKTFSGSLTLAFAGLGWLANASATDLVLRCDLTAEDSNGTQNSYERRIEIIMEPRYFRAFKSDSSGFQSDGEGFPAFMSRAIIVFAEDETAKESYDQNTGDYLYRNTLTGREVTGNCDRVVDRTTGEIRVPGS